MKNTNNISRMIMLSVILLIAIFMFGCTDTNTPPVKSDTSTSSAVSGASAHPASPTPASTPAVQTQTAASSQDDLVGNPSQVSDPGDSGVLPTGGSSVDAPSS